MTKEERTFRTAVKIGSPFGRSEVDHRVVPLDGESRESVNASPSITVRPTLLADMHVTWFTVPLKVQGGRQADATKGPADLLPYEERGANP